MTTFRGGGDSNEAGHSISEGYKSSVKNVSNHGSVAKASDGKKTNSAKNQKQTHDSAGTDRETKPPPFSIDRTSSEGASGKVKVSRTYKKAQDTENRKPGKEKENTDLIRSVSVSAAVSTSKRLPAVPPTSKTGDKHGYETVKGTEKDKTHKYANVDLNEEATSSLEPKYDTVDTDGTKKTKGESGDHYYHSLEDSRREAPAINEEEYSSPTRMALKVNKEGNAQVMSTEEGGASNDNKVIKSKRAKSYSGKNTSKNKKAKDHEYDQPSHNTLPHGANTATKNKEKSGSMQAGKLASIFDDPTYVTSVDVSSTTPGGAAKPAEGSSPKRLSADDLVLRQKLEQDKKSAEKGKGDPEYDEPNEKKGKLTKNTLYSSRLFDDPKYEVGTQS